jgi:hypothetical protein
MTASPLSMRLSSKLVKSTAVVFLALAVIASAAMAGRARQYTDKDQGTYQVSIRANPNRVLLGSFGALDYHALRCDNGGARIVGSWTIENVKITNGHFRTVREDSNSDTIRYTLMFRGTLKGDTIRGAVSLHLAYREANYSYDCWSGKGKNDPVVSYVAKAGR